MGYFDGRMLNRKRLLWALAARRQLERWEPHVAESVRRGFANRGDDLDSADIWAAANEHHYLLIAANHMIRAIELRPPLEISVDETVRNERVEGRDLPEHWINNMPIFNSTPGLTTRLDLPADLLDVVIDRLPA